MENENFNDNYSVDDLRIEAQLQGLCFCNFSLHLVEKEYFIEDEGVCKDCLRKMEIMKTEDYPNNYILHPEILGQQLV